ncbi:MAG: DNA-processing protein DprA [Armatimonadetes bacterium]|nr:DNA-processing protein DprA [Armatimonadota bacterium]
MRKGELLAIEATMYALYLRGSPYGFGVSRRGWPLTLAALRSACPTLDDVAYALRCAGRWEESAALSASDALCWGLSVAESGRALSAASPGYPGGWLHALGSAAPPCLWVRGRPPTAPAVGVVGSRLLDRGDREFAGSVGALLVRGGRTVVSGGAPGADSVVASAAVGAGGGTRAVVIAPYGLDSAAAVNNFAEAEGACVMSVCPPRATFTTGRAMERNALIYSYGRRAVVVRARLRCGGTWHGACDALRRGLGEVLVRLVPGDAASSALVALGGVGLRRLDDLPAALCRPVKLAQPELFGAGPVREASARYLCA